MIDEAGLPETHRAALALVRKEDEPSTARIAGHLAFAHGWRGDVGAVLLDLQRAGLVVPVRRGVKRWRAMP